jgi:hypothetical protein
MQHVLRQLHPGFRVTHALGRPSFFHYHQDRPMRNALRMAALATLFASFSTFAHHPAPGIVEDDTYEMLADTPHADMDLSRMGRCVNTARTSPLRRGAVNAVSMMRAFAPGVSGERFALPGAKSRSGCR